MFLKGIRNSVQAKKVEERAERIADVAESKMYRAKNETTTALEDFGKLKLQIYDSEVKNFVELFSKIKNIESIDPNIGDQNKKLGIDVLQVQEMKDISLTATSLLKGIATGAGAGALLGWGTYGGVMALGTASTGTAIAGLSGAAATNATLAWLGGGAIASGGGGMALGSMVLGGIVAVPALLIAGGIIGAKGTECLNNAKSNLASAKQLNSDVDVAVAQLNIIKEAIEENKTIILQLQKRVNVSNKVLSELVSKKVNWNNYTNEERETVYDCFKTVQLLKKIIEIPLLTEKGNVTKEAQNVKSYI